MAYVQFNPCLTFSRSSRRFRRYSILFIVLTFWRSATLISSICFCCAFPCLLCVIPCRTGWTNERGREGLTVAKKRRSVENEGSEKSTIFDAVFPCSACHMCVRLTRLTTLLGCAGPSRSLARTDPCDRAAFDVERCFNAGRGFS